MAGPHVHIPYDMIGEHLDYIRASRLDLEIFFSAGMLDGLSPSGISGLRSSLVHSPSITVHAPFMDLSPGGVDRKVREVTRQRFAQAFDAAEALGARAVVFHSGYEKWKYAHRVDIWLEGSLGLWPEFIERASSGGMKIAVENIFEDEPGNLRLLMDELGSPHMGICFDTGHFNLFSRAPLSVWIESIGSHIVELHLHDNDGGSDEHKAVGDGNFDFEGLFKALKGRDIIHTIEAHNREDLVKSLERLKAFI